MEKEYPKRKKMPRPGPTGMAGTSGSVRELNKGDAAGNLNAGIYAAGLSGHCQKIWPHPEIRGQAGWTLQPTHPPCVVPATDTRGPGGNPKNCPASLGSRSDYGYPLTVAAKSGGPAKIISWFEIGLKVDRHSGYNPIPHDRSPAWLFAVGLSRARLPAQRHQRHHPHPAMPWCGYGQRVPAQTGPGKP